MATSASWCSASGKTRPSKLEICKGHDHRTPTARRATRALYQQRLRRALERHLPGFTIAELSNAMDLERSFGPIYARGMVRQGRSAFAAFGVNQQQTQSSIDAALTFGILWLDACRHSADPRALLEGLSGPACRDAGSYSGMPATPSTPPAPAAA